MFMSRKRLNSCFYGLGEHIALVAGMPQRLDTFHQIA
jgi:hypothetical protein